MQLTLSHWSLLLGAALIVPGVFALAGGARAAAAAKGFARHVWAGRILATLAWAWAGWATYTMPLEFIASFRSWIPVMTLVAIPLSWYWMADLLGCRAIGGLLVLFPCPLFQASNASASPLRLVLVIVAYVAIVVGMTLLLYPYQLRRWLDWLAARPVRLRAAGAAVAILGGCFVVLGLTAFA